MYCRIVVLYVAATFYQIALPLTSLRSDKFCCLVPVLQILVCPTSNFISVTSVNDAFVLNV